MLEFGYFTRIYFSQMKEILCQNTQKISRTIFWVLISGVICNMQVCKFQYMWKCCHLRKMVRISIFWRRFFIHTSISKWKNFHRYIEILEPLSTHPYHEDLPHHLKAIPEPSSTCGPVGNPGHDGWFLDNDFDGLWSLA